MAKELSQMVYKPRRERRAKGGKAGETEPMSPEHGHQYNAEGSPEAKEEDAKSDGFKRGGMLKKKRKEGGKVEGEHARHHLGRRARGGATKREEERKEEHKEERKEHREEPEHRARGGHVKHRARGGTAFSEGRKLVAAPGKGSEKSNGPGEDAETIP